LGRIIAGSRRASKFPNTPLITIVITRSLEGLFIYLFTSVVSTRRRGDQGEARPRVRPNRDPAKLGPLEAPEVISIANPSRRAFSSVPLAYSHGRGVSRGHAREREGK
jgi:hypothetical protein